jgi:hypothetical protein
MAGANELTIGVSDLSTGLGYDTAQSSDGWALQHYGHVWEHEAGDDATLQWKFNITE